MFTYGERSIIGAISLALVLGACAKIPQEQQRPEPRERDYANKNVENLEGFAIDILCIDGVRYLRYASHKQAGLSVKYTSDGKIETCGSPKTPTY